MVHVDLFVFIYTVESAYFKVIWTKKGLQVIRIHRARKLKNVDDRSEMYTCAGGWGWTNSFLSCSLIADSCL